MGFFDGDWYVRGISTKGSGVINKAVKVTISSTNKNFRFRPVGAAADEDVSLGSADDTEFTEGTSATYKAKGRQVLNSTGLKIFVGSIKKGTTDIEAFVAFSQNHTTGFVGTWSITKLQSHGTSAVHKDSTHIVLTENNFRFKNQSSVDEDVPIAVSGAAFAGKDTTHRVKGQMIIPGLVFLGFLGKGNPPGKRKKGPAGDDNTESFVAVKMG